MTFRPDEDEETRAMLTAMAEEEGMSIDEARALLDAIGEAHEALMGSNPEYARVIERIANAELQEEAKPSPSVMKKPN